MLNKMIFSTLTALLMTFAVLNTSVAGPVFGGGCGGKGKCGYDMGLLSEDEIYGLQYMREEEKLARDIYLIMSDEHELIIFKTIARSEDKHMAAVKNLLDKYDIKDPAEDETPATEGEDFTNKDLGEDFEYFKIEGLKSPMDALQVGGEIEEIDMADLRKEILLADNTDIISTYENLLCGSRNHLRAFVRQLELRGGSYDPLELEDDELAAIVEPTIATKCGYQKKSATMKDK